MTRDTIPGDTRTLHDVTTPCLVLEQPKLLANVERLKARMAGSAVSMRPHLKTVKCHEAAVLALESPTGPATVSTLKEAEEFGRRGITDLLYAVCLSPQKLDRVSELRRSGIDLKVIVDSVEMAGHIAAHARAVGDPIPTLIEIDVDGHRSGVPATKPELVVEIGRELQNGAQLAGVLTHAGDSYALSEPSALARAAEEERARTVAMAEALRAAGLPCPIVSIGSTPTIFAGASLEGITEVRVGVYMFFDLVQAGIGICGTGEIALGVLATVIGNNRDKGWIIVDAGWTAMSRDRGTAEQAVDQYYGTVGDINGQLYDDVVLLKTSQEHGIIAVRPGSPKLLPELAIGDRVRILPNHACATAAQHDEYQVVNGAGDIVDVWPRFRGW